MTPVRASQIIIKGQVVGVGPFSKGYVAWGWVCTSPSENIKDVRLNLYVTDTQGVRKNIANHEVLAGWVESSAPDYSAFQEVCGAENRAHKFIYKISHADVVLYDGLRVLAQVSHGGQELPYYPSLHYSNQIILDTTTGYTEVGWVKGAQNPTYSNVTQFKGIRYGRAPVGLLRWAKSVPARATPPEAKVLTQACLQESGAFVLPRRAVQSEDCLFLNVWRPKTQNHPAPVVVYIHGGQFRVGWSGLDDYDGAYMASQGTVFVSFNYRVGMMGFFRHPLFNEGENSRGHVNFGLSDQELALQWVQKNISEFGGDPKNVTLVGSSAGGASVGYWLANQKANGLFHRAIMESGGGSLTSWLETKSFVEQRGNQMINELRDFLSRDSRLPASCRSSTALSVDCTRALLFETSVEDLRKTSYFSRYLQGDGSRFDPITRKSFFEFHPILDNDPGQLNGYVNSGTLEAFKCGQQKDLPLIVGSMGWEASIVTSAIASKSPSELRSTYFYNFSDTVMENLRKEYGIYNDDKLLAERFYGDRVFAVPARILSDYHSVKNKSTFNYFFNYVGDGMNHEKGAPHTLLTPFVFHTLNHNSIARAFGDNGPTTTDLNVAKVWSGYWLNFIKGHFDSQGLSTSAVVEVPVKWKPYSVDYENRLLINRSGALDAQSGQRELGNEHTINYSGLLKKRLDQVEKMLYSDAKFAACPTLK